MPQYKDYNSPPYNVLQHYIYSLIENFKYYELHKKRLGRL